MLPNVVRLPFAHPFALRYYRHCATLEAAVCSLMACGIERRVAAQLVRETAAHESDRAYRTIPPPDFERRLSELQRRVAAGATRRVDHG